MTAKPPVLVLRTAGTNCDKETEHAFEVAGGDVRRTHINRLIENPRLLDDAAILAIPGGFSYGDDIAAGKIFATLLMQKLGDPLRKFIARGRPIAGICNGFQVLVRTELLPGPLAGLGGQTCTLSRNVAGRFDDRWITLAPRSAKCIWTRDLPPTFELPVAHGEGRFVTATDAVRHALWAGDQVALVYTRPDGSPAGGQIAFNPNGSTDDIAGICDPTGLVFGMMPHPERHVSPLQHPAWTQQRPVEQFAVGLRFFRNAIEHVR